MASGGNSLLAGSVWITARLKNCSVFSGSVVSINLRIPRVSQDQPFMIILREAKADVKDILFCLGFIEHKSTWAVTRTAWRESALFCRSRIGRWDPLPLLEVKHVAMGPRNICVADVH